MDQAYLTAIENEDLWVTMAWSGDILNDKLYFPEFATFEFAVPDAGRRSSSSTTAASRTRRRTRSAR